MGLDPTRLLHQFTVDVWKVNDGLPQNSVVSILQTPDGYLWMGTYDGLARFDGIKFDTFNPVSLVNAQNKVITSLFPSRDGGFYMATSGAIGRYHRGEFTRLPIREDFTKMGIQSVFEDHSGALWIGTRNGGLRRFQNGQLQRFAAPEFLPHNNVRALQEDASGSLWIATEKGLCRYSAGRFTVFGRRDGLQGEYIISLHVDHSSRLWIGTRGGGLHLMQKDRFVSFPFSEDENAKSITCITSDADGNLWFGSLVGLHRLREGKFETLPFSSGDSRIAIRSVLMDREGNLWVGTNGDGLARLKDGKFITYTKRNGLSNNVIMAISGDSRGNLWCGTNCGGANLLKDGKFSALTVRDGLSDDCIWTVAADRKGDSWFGTYSKGLNRLSRGKITHFTVREGLKSDEIRALRVDRWDALWVGTRNGLNRIEGGKVSAYTAEHGLSSGDIRAIWDDADGVIWIGTYGGGLNRLKEGQFKVYTHSDGLAADYILSLYGDREGHLWIGTNGGGLSRFSNGKFFTLSTKEGFPSDNIYQILEDDLGRLWMSYNQGIFRVQLKDLNDYAEGRSAALRVVDYKKADGVPADGIQGGFQPAGWRDPQGILWFPTVGGLTSIDPAREKTNPVPPLLSVERILVNGKVVDKGAPSTFPPGEGRLEFHYSGLSLQSAEKVLFRYKLEGSDHSWVEAGKRRSAYYTNILPGDYTFRVTACNNDGIWNETGTQYSFRLKPYFYQTKIFFLLCSLGLILLIAAAVSLRVRHLKDQQRKLRAEVEKAMAEVKTLSGLLPICASCKKIRDDKGYWNHVESYISHRSQATFSHGICPDCAARLYPEYPYTEQKSRPS